MVFNMKRTTLSACFSALMASSADAGRPPSSAVVSVSDDEKQLCHEFIAGRSPLSWAVRIAQAELSGKGGTPTVSPGQRGRLGAGIGYTHAFWAIALFRLSEATGDTSWQEYGINIFSPYIEASGAVHDINGRPLTTFTFNEMLTGRALLDAMQYSAEPRFVHAASLFRTSLGRLPRTKNGVFAYHPDNIISDGLYMTLPFYAQYTRQFNQPEDYTDVVRQLQTAFAVLYDPATQLLHHGWDEQKTERWADKITGQSHGYWGRGVGWYAMALIDVLDNIPFGYDQARSSLTEQVNSLAAGLLRHQAPQTGLWYNVPNQPQKPGNFAETSSSAMYVYFLAKGINKGFLDGRYLQPALSAFDGIIKHRIRTDKNGTPHLLYSSNVASLGKVPGQPDPVVNRDGSWEYYMSEGISADNPHAIPAFVMAAIEMDRLLQFEGACRVQPDKF